MYTFVQLVYMAHVSYSTLWYTFGVCIIRMCTCTLRVCFVCVLCAVLFYIHKLYEVPICGMWHVRVLFNFCMVCVVGIYSEYMWYVVDVAYMFVVFAMCF